MYLVEGLVLVHYMPQDESLRKTIGSGPLGSVCGGLPLRRKYASRMSREKRIRFIGDAIESL